MPSPKSGGEWQRRRTPNKPTWRHTIHVEGGSSARIVGCTVPYSAAMSNHSEAPVAPVEAYEPPYYVAVFTAVRTQDQSGYSEINARMEDLVKDVPGFLGMDHAQTPGGLSITVGYFRDADALTEWRCNAEHRAAQKRGRVEWYQSYTLHVAKVERSHGFMRA
jgi:heme-degrading monooxygenase HmoA